MCSAIPSTSKVSDSTSGNFENSKKDNGLSDDNDDDDGVATNINISKKNVAPEKDLKKSELDLTPKCVSIPNKWNLKDLKVESDVEKKPRKNSDKNAEFDADWELV